MKKYKGKYRIGSHRRPQWDYSANALYFLTIVTQGRKCILGEVKNAEIILSEMGRIVHHEFLKSFDIREELFLCEYVIMPNHIHTIVEIRNPNNNPVQPQGPADPVQPHGRAVQRDINDPAIQRDINTKNDLPIKRNPPIRLPKSISSFIAGFKSSVKHPN